MQMSMHGVIISVYDDEKNKFIGLESFRLVGLKNENQVAGELDSLIKEREWISDTFKKVSVWFRMFEFEACEVFKINEFTFVNDCFKYERNEETGHYG